MLQTSQNWFAEQLLKTLGQEVRGEASWAAGLLFEQDGQIANRRRLMRALERACAGLGVRFQEGAEVLSLEQHNGGTLSAVRLRTAEGEEQRLPAQRAVLSCGAWSARLLPELPVFPVKGQMLSLQGPRQALTIGICEPPTATE